MKTLSKSTILLFIVTLMISPGILAQNNVFTCQNVAYEYLERIIGNWNVNTKDRTSPGNYETNKGKSVITNSIIGCGIKESFRGFFRGKPYAREVMIVGKDAVGIEMVTSDSEHNSFSILTGTINEEQIIVYWYRNLEVKKLQSKYILTIENQNKFEFSSFLSTDYGKNWVLTHERKYFRIKTN